MEELGLWSCTNGSAMLDCCLFTDANLLFLDSPTGVGYSYSDDQSENLSGGDARTGNFTYCLRSYVETYTCIFNSNNY